MHILFSLRTLNFLVALALATMLFVSTRWGLGMSADSVGYLKAAIGALNGEGLTQFSSNWPPLYPALLTVFGWLTGENVQLGARLLHALLLATNYLLIVQLLLRMTLPGYQAIIFGLLVSTHHVLTYVHFYAWSEPAFITLILIGLLMLSSLSNTLDRNEKTLTIEVMLAILTGMAMLLRYAGVALLLSNVNALLILTRHAAWTIRLRGVALQCILPILMLLPWLGFNLMRSQSATQRTLTPHFPNVELLKNGLSTIGRWFTSEVFGNVILFQMFIGLSLVGLCFGVLIQAARKGIRTGANNIALFVSVFTLTYLLFLLLSISFIDVATPLDDRILSPVFVCMVLLLAGLGTRIRQSGVRKAVMIGLVISVGFSSQQLKSWLLINYYDGVELTSRIMRDRAIIKFVQSCSPDMVLASDTPWDFDLHLQTKALWLPRLNNMTSGLRNTNYAEEMQSLGRMVDMIVVTDLSSSYSLEIDQQTLFRRIYSGNDGTIWINQQTMRPPCALVRNFK